MSKEKFEDELFGDLELEPGVQQSPVPPPALTQVPGFETLSSSGDLSKLEQQAHLKQSQSSIKTALKEPLPQGPNKVVLASIIAVLLLVVAGGSMYIMGLGPFASANNGSNPVVKRFTVRRRTKKGRQLLYVGTSPEGAVLWINGNPYPGKTPHNVVLMPMRTYKLALKLEGYQDVTKTLNIKAPQKPIRWIVAFKKKGQKEPKRDKPPDLRVLKNGEGFLKVVCDPADAVVTLGQMKPVKCPATLQIDGGSHPLSVEKEGYESYSAGITVKPGSVSTYSVKLKPIKGYKFKKRPVASAKPDKRGKPSRRRGRGTLRRRRRRRPRAKGSVMIACQPSARVYLGKRKLGVTPLSVKLPPGRHQLKLRGPNGLYREISIRVRPKKTTKAKVSFRYGRVKFKVKPWADVYLRGKKIGQTPIPPYKIREGFHTFVLRKGKARATKKVRVRGNQTAYVFYFF